LTDIVSLDVHPASAPGRGNHPGGPPRGSTARCRGGGGKWLKRHLNPRAGLPATIKRPCTPPQTKHVHQNGTSVCHFVVAVLIGDVDYSSQNVGQYMVTATNPPRELGIGFA